MKNFKKALSVILALVMVVSVFAACGNDKKSEKSKEEDTTKAKTEEKITGTELLVGAWKTYVSEDEISFPLIVTFDKDGSAHVEFNQDCYKELLNLLVNKALEEGGFNSLSASEKLAFFEELGVTNLNEAKQALYDIYAGDVSFDTLHKLYNFDGSWTLVDDVLTVDINGDTITVNTNLTDGEESFTVTYDGMTLDFAKV